MFRRVGAAFCARNAIVESSRVQLGEQASVWYGAVVRGSTKVGSRTNIQDLAVVVDSTIDEEVTVGHAAYLQGCHVERGCLIGIGAVIQPGAVVESGAQVAANAVVEPGTRVQTGTIFAGNPACLFRPLKRAEQDFLQSSALQYVQNAEQHWQATLDAE